MSEFSTDTDYTLKIPLPEGGIQSLDCAQFNIYLPDRHLVWRDLLELVVNFMKFNRDRDLSSIRRDEFSELVGSPYNTSLQHLPPWERGLDALEAPAILAMYPKDYLAIKHDLKLGAVTFVAQEDTGTFIIDGDTSKIQATLKEMLIFACQILGDERTKEHFPVYYCPHLAASVQINKPDEKLTLDAVINRVRDFSERMITEYGFK